MSDVYSTVQGNVARSNRIISHLETTRTKMVKVMNECFSSKIYYLFLSFLDCPLLPPSFPPKAARSQTNSLGSSIEILDKQALVAISLSSTQTKDLALTFQNLLNQK